MERNDPLLPFAFTANSKDEKIALNTDPRDRYVIDQNASSMYHTRSTQRDQTIPDESSLLRGPVILSIPSIKRKMGESFSEKDDIKRRDYDFFNGIEGQTSSGYSNIATQFTAETSLESSSGEIGPKKMLNNFPSSPPVYDPVSEFDTSNHDITIPDSPVGSNNKYTLETSPIKREYHAQSSEPDFGIDSFNRFKVSSLNHHPSTDNDVECDYFNRSDKFTRAREVLLQAFEDTSPSVSLAHMELTDIPDEIKDLNNLVIFDTQSLRQLYLNNNNLRVLNPNLFDFTKLNVLSLRQNKLIFIPNLIEQFTNLYDLNLSINKLRYLPPLILNLPSLHTFRAGPNPFLEVCDDATEIAELDSRYTQGLRFVSPMKIKGEQRVVPLLKSLCLNTIANYDVTYRETKNWKRSVSKIYHPLIALAISKGQFKEKCNECDLIVVESYAKAYEWWNILLNKNIPIKRRFCSGKCAYAYSNRSYEI